MPVTLLVEPSPIGHRFQSVALVTAEAARTGPVILLTSAGATDHDACKEFLANCELQIEATLDGTVPSTKQLVAEIVRLCRQHQIGTVLLLDADQCLKRWWFDAPRALRRLGRRRPDVMFMLTRYPADISLGDRFGWALRVSKGTLVLLARGAGALQRVSGYTGRADLSCGLIVKRVRDPAICTAHSRDRDAIRAELGLHPAQSIVGIFGVISRRKYVPLVFAALQQSGVDADLLLGGDIDPEVLAWIDALPPRQRAHVITLHGFLSDHEIDRAVAAVDVVALAMTNNGPSGIMGKALAAGVPVVTAGSRVRADEVRGTNNGLAAELNAQSFATALREILTGRYRPAGNPAPLTTPTEYARCLLGLANNGETTTGPCRDR